MATRGTSGSSAVALRVLSIVMGTFLLFMGIDKAGWLTDPEPLSSRLYEWLESAPPVSRWYLERVAIPGAPVFARLVLLGELTAGAALVLGFQVRLAAAVALLMILNFHFASDVLLHASYLTNGYGPPVIGSLLALTIGGAALPWTISKQRGVVGGRARQRAET